MTVVVNHYVLFVSHGTSLLLCISRCFGLIENSAQEHTRNDSMAMDRLNPEETMMEVGLLSTFNAIMQQSSDQIYDVSLADLISGGMQNKTRKRKLLVFPLRKKT